MRMPSAPAVTVRKQCRFHAIGRADEQDLSGIQVPRRGDGAVHHRVGRVIAAHGVDRNADHCGVGLYSSPTGRTARPL